MVIRIFCLLATLALAQAAQAGTLFDQFGQRPGLEKLVASAAAIWTHDPRVAPTFEDTNLERFQRLLVDQLCQLLDGGCTYGGRDMHDSHKGLHIDTAQFNAVVEDLQLAMNEQEIPFHTQNRLLALLAPMYRDVVTK